MDVVPRPAKVRIAEIVCPELRAIPAGDRARALREASGVPFDIAELMGAAFGLVLVAWLARFGAGVLASFDRTLAATASALIALALVALVLVPVLVRRLRRGIRKQMTAAPRMVHDDDR